jgi:transposase
MRRFVEGTDRGQSTLFPECLEDWIGADNPVRVIDVFVDELDLAALGFDGVEPEVTGRPSYHPSVLLKLYIYGYLNRVQSSRRLEREAGRNVEVMWLTGPFGSRSQDDCQFPQGQWHCDPPGLRAVRCAVPHAISLR